MMLMAFNNDTVVSKDHLTGLGGEFQCLAVFFLDQYDYPIQATYVQDCRKY